MNQDQLRRFAPAAVKHFDSIVEAAKRFAINTPNRFHFWMANCAYESSAFTDLDENLYYSRPERLVLIFRRYFDRNRDGTISKEELEFAKDYCRDPQRLANYVYANRMGNGPPESNDGWKHRGQGPIQLTGSDNHRAYSLDMYGDLRVWRDPTMLTREPDAMLSAGWFVRKNGLNEVADRGDFKGYCGLINTGSIRGAAHGLDDYDPRDLDSREDWRRFAVSCFPTVTGA